MIDFGFGAGIGEYLRKLHFAVKSHRFEQGAPVRISCRVHWGGQPDWRLHRGSLRGTPASPVWQPRLRRWKAFDLGNVSVGTIMTVDSAANGRRQTISVQVVPPIDRFVVSPEVGPLLVRLLERARSLRDEQHRDAAGNQV